MKKRKVAELVRGQDLLELPPQATVREAARALAARHVGAVLVREKGQLLGIFTERDMVNRVEAVGRDPDTMRLAEAMTRAPRTIGADAPAIEALRGMRDGGFRHLPVMRGSELVGVLSLRDFLPTELMEVEREAEVKVAFVEGGRKGD